MNREIKFRGKRIDKLGWAFGYYVHDLILGHRILQGESGYINVDPSTVGQYTGLKDNKGVEIYDGDIVRSESHNPSYYKIEFIEGGFCATYGNLYPIDINHFYPSVGCEITVIGNIHDNSKPIKQ